MSWKYGTPKPVIQLNKDGEVIGEFHSARGAAKHYYLNPNTVMRICNGIIKQNRDGFIFKWKEGDA